jgi:purine catabolism regulator
MTTPTLRALLAVPGLGLRVIAGGPDALDRAISWVAATELADPTPYLEGGELVLLTGVSLQLDGAQAGGYVDRLVARGVSAVGFGIGIVHDAVPAELVAAADARGLPLLEVDPPTPFIAVGKALADLLSAAATERGRRRVEAMRTLTTALAGGAEQAAVLRRLAGRVGGWVAVLDGRGEVLLAAGAPARPDAAADLVHQLRGRGGHASATSADGTGRAAVLPLGLGDRVHGYLAVATGAGVEPDHSLVAFAASLLTLDRERSDGTRPAGPRGVERRWARAAVLADRLGLAPPTPPAALLGPLADAAASVVVVHLAQPVDPDLADDERVLCLPVELQAGPVGLTHALPTTSSDADAGTVLVVCADDAPEVIAGLAAVPGVRGGVSRPLPAADVVQAAREARSLAARSRHGLLHADDAPPSLRELLGPAAAQAFADAVLRPLAADGPATDALLRQTLTAWLAAGGETGTAAAALGVHRHTLRERLRRAATLLGADLDDAGLRAELWVALDIHDRADRPA